MFYSQTFLAKKGPLGTVWCAAHLQHRLRKSHYTSTDVIATVDRIMFPEVPIALRMSGHLLLGIVRIYSKKVEYLVHDCNLMLVTLKRAFATADVTLPENASTAKAEAVTLPPVLDFDALDIDDVCSAQKTADAHLVSSEDITLPSVVVHNRDQYIAVTFEDAVDGAHESSPEVGALRVGDQAPVSDPIEEIRAARVSQLDEDIPGKEQAEVVDPIEVVIPIELPRFQEGFFVPEIPPRPETPPIVGSNPISIVSGGSIEIDYIDTPPVEDDGAPRQTPPRSRKRKLQFDKDPVLKNKFMRESLNETKDLLRRKRAAPPSSSSLWRFDKKHKDEGIFFGSSFSGIADDLTHILNADLASLKPTEAPSSPPPTADMTNNGGFTVPATVDVSTVPSTSVIDDDFVSIIGDWTNGTGFGSSTSPSKASSVRTTPSFTGPSSFLFSSKSSGFGSSGTGVGSTGTGVASTGTGLGFDHPLPDIQEEDGHEAEDLGFLDNDQSPCGSDGDDGGKGSLSVRTRAVAKYLCEKSPAIVKTPGSSVKEVSLNQILEGKAAKKCARMFFEILVLKNCGMLDVQQEKVYDDIKLKVAPAVLKV